MRHKATIPSLMEVTSTMASITVSKAPKISSTKETAIKSMEYPIKSMVAAMSLEVII